MTREDIIRMAREAECEETWGMDAFRFTIEELERFAALVAAAEREACAKICDGEATLYYSAQRCATKIRARGSDGTAT